MQIQSDAKRPASSRHPNAAPGGNDRDGGDVVIRCRGLGKTVNSSAGGLTILHDVNLDVRRGESIAVVGASGSGKSTLLGLLAGLDLPSHGRVVLDGHDLTALDEEARARVRGECVGFVFQSFHLLPGLTALENVMLPAELRGDASPERAARELLKRVGLEQRMQHVPNQLSGGEQQRVALARAFASSAKVLFADEPTGNLDTETGATVGDLLFELNREFGTTLVLVTHDPDLAGRCERRIEIHSGRLTAAPAK